MHTESTSSSWVTVESPDPAVALIRINRPEQRNALCLVLKRALQEAVARADADPATRAIVLTGSDTFFVAGTDLREMMDMTSHDHTTQDTAGVFRVISACRKPVIAAVEGYALGGGCELALACDIIIAGQGAQFGQPEIRVGIMPGAGGTQRLLRTIGKYQTMKMILTGEAVEADQAFAMGLVSEVVEKGTALQNAVSLARKIAGMPMAAVRSIKEVVNAGQNLPLDGALMLERKAFALLFETFDQEEGMRAFLEKRKANYQTK